MTEIPIELAEFERKLTQLRPAGPFYSVCTKPKKMSNVPALLLIAASLLICAFAAPQEFLKRTELKSGNGINLLERKAFSVQNGSLRERAGMKVNFLL